MKKLNRKSASSPPLPLLFKKICLYTILPHPFLVFHIAPPPGEVIKIYSLPFKKRGGGEEIFQVLFYFLCKNCNAPEKSHPLLSQQPPALKIEILSSTPPCLKIWLDAHPPPPPPAGREGGGAHCVKACVILVILEKNNMKTIEKRWVVNANAMLARCFTDAQMSWNLVMDLWHFLNLKMFWRC